MIAAGVELRREAGEDAATVVSHRTRLAVDEPSRGADFAAEGLDDRLMPEANAEGRHTFSEPPDDLECGACVARTARARRDDEVGGSG